MRIGIDIDGVLFPFDTVARQELGANQEPSKSWSALKYELTPLQWDWLWSAYGQDVVFGAVVNCYWDAVKAVQAILRETSHEVHFVTNRDPALAGYQTARFLHQHFHGLRWAGLHMLGRQATIPKWKLARWDVFVDDKPETVFEFLAHTDTQVFAPRRPWNESELEDNLYLTVYDNPGVILDYIAAHDGEWERVLRAVTRPADPGLPGAKAVTADALKEHANKFGPEAVQDTAASVGLRVTVDAVAPPSRKRKR